MPVTALLDAVAAHLEGVLTAGTPVGVAEPTTDAELPAVSMWLAEVVPSLPGTGRIPAAVRTGALPVETEIDLADPVLRIGATSVPLLSADRLLLQLPHGSIVRADGAAELPFATADLLISHGGTTFVPVTDSPTGDQCRPDPVSGSVTFGTPLPAAGALTLRYFVGAWETSVECYAGELHVEAFAATAGATEAISAQVVAGLHRPGLIAGVRRLDPAGVGAIAVAGFGSARRRNLTYRFDFELETAVVQTGGGPVRSVAVTIVTPGPEQFTVTRKELSP